MQPSADVSDHRLDGQTVLFSQSRQSLFALSPAASIVWDDIRSGLDPADLVNRLARDAMVGSEQAARYVDELVTQLAGLGLIGDSAVEPLVGEKPAATFSEPVADIPPLPPTGPDSVSRAYRLLDTRFSLSLSDASDIGPVDSALGHLEHPADSFDVRIQVLRSGDHCYIYRDTSPLADCRRPDGLVPMLKGAMVQSAINRFDYVLYLHAGVVADRRGRVMLMPGASGSGKSCTTAALVKAGFEYFSDEVALLSRSSMRVARVPLGICLKSAAWPALSALLPGLMCLPEHRREDGKRVRYLPPPGAHRDAPQRRAGRARWIVFPCYRPDAGISLAPISRVESLRLLLGECKAIPNQLVAEDVYRLVDWIQNIDCYRLDYSSLETVTCRLEQLASATE